jgi:hypothetical protein
MSVLIKGMEMPKTCNDCGLRDSFDCWITYSYIEARFSKRNDNCPLIELPPHGRLGDLDKLMTEFMDSDLDHLQRDDWKEVIQIVADAPTVIERSET